MIILTIMVVTKIYRYGDEIVFKDKGLKGYIIEFTDLHYYSELNGYPHVKFRCLDDYYILKIVIEILLS